MKKIFLILTALVVLISCTSTKKSIVKMPKLKKEPKSSKRQIKKYTQEFVRNLYNTTKLKDTLEIETIIQN